MEFEEFQRAWQAVKSEPKSHDELRRMMYSSPVWRFRGLTRKEVVGLSVDGLVTIGLITGLVIYDPDAVPMAIILSMGILLYNYFGLRYLRFIPQKDTLQETLTHALVQIKRLVLISRIINVVIWIALAVILGTSEQTGTMNIFRWALMLLPLLAVGIWWSSRKWLKQRDEVNALLEELGEEESLPAV